MPAQSAAAGFPFATQPIQQDHGVIYGVDKRDKTPILLDPFSWRSYSMARMGASGSGKSYAASIEILRAHLAYPGLQIIVVDPKKEYKHLVKTLGGTMHTLEPGNNYSFEEQVLGFELKERGQLDNVELLVEIVQQIYSKTSQDQKKTLVLIDEARILMNDDRGRRILNQFVLESRDTNTGVYLISQNASHFTSWREGREILDNMPGKILMQHERVPDNVVDYFRLSQREEQELYELKTGTDSNYSEALLKVSGRLDTRIQIESTLEEHAIIEPRSRQ
jgi:type IV secretory pathway VirB4 component